MNAEPSTSLRYNLRQLRALVETIGAELSFSPDDHATFMRGFFVAKQFEHSTAVLALGKHPDGGLVARSMLEGLWQLKWAMRKPSERPYRWRAFAWVQDWRALQRNDSLGKATSPEKRQEIEEGLAQVQDLFYTKEARKTKEAGESLPQNPFENNWYGISLRKMASAVQAAPLYDGPYNYFSNRHHWDPAGVAQGIKVDGLKLKYSAASQFQEDLAVLIAFQCLAECSQVFSLQNRLGKEAQIQELIDSVVNSHASK
jgi:Family of unknown function (DUF5677)